MILSFEGSYYIFLYVTSSRSRLAVERCSRLEDHNTGPDRVQNEQFIDDRENLRRP